MSEVENSLFHLRQEVVDLPRGRKLYFASDFHLGAPNETVSREREQRIIHWLNQVSHDAHAIYLVGDIFDFWYEYKYVIPKGFTRLQGKLAELRDSGVSISFLPGNHDMWMFSYFQEELGIAVYNEPIEVAVGAQRLVVGHGDGLGEGEWAYKALKKAIYYNPVCRWVFSFLHPDWGVGFARRWSAKGRSSGMKKVKPFRSKERETLYVYCQQLEGARHHDFYIFGHRHLALDLTITPHSRYINLGDWMSLNTYAVYDGRSAALLTFPS